MEPTSREIFKNSLIKGVINKYSAEKETLLAEVTLILEGNASNPETVASSFESKINRLSEVESNLVQMEMMFMGQNSPKECCDNKESCEQEDK
jgi:hypothetical protein